MNHKKFWTSAALCLTVGVLQMFAGPLVTAATTISNEIVQVAAIIGGAIIILATLTMAGGGMGSRIIMALIEVAVLIFVLMNPQSIASWFRFGG